MIFSWLGIDQNGEQINGTITAINQSEAQFLLYEKNILVLKIHASKNSNIPAKNKIKTKHLFEFFRQLSILLNANITLTKALVIIASNDKNLSVLSNSIKKLIESGMQLNQALAQFPQYFESVTCNLIHIGEQSGTLDTILLYITTYLEKTQKQKQKICKALIYPTSVIIITLIVTIVLLFFVIPQFEELFANFGAKLPSYTRFIIALGNYTKKNIFTILLSPTILFVSFYFAKKHSFKFKKYCDYISLKIPISNKILTYAIISNINKTLAITTQAGIPLITSLKLTTNTLKNQLYRESLTQITAEISAGLSLQQAIKNQ